MSGVIRGAVALAFGSGSGAILSFVLALIIGRGWGQIGLGVYTAALAWMTPLSLITEAGLGTLFVRDLARHPDQTAAYVQTAIRQRVMVGGGLALCLSLGASFISDDVMIQHGIRYSAPLIMILPLYATFTALLRLQGRMTLVAALNIGMLAVQVSLTALLWHAQAAFEAILLVNTLTSGGQCALAAWLTQEAWEGSKHTGLVHHTHTERMRVKDLMELGLPFAMAAVIAALQMRLIVIMLEQTTTAAEVGLYAAAFKGVEIARLLALAVFDALFPMLSSLAADRAKMQRLFMTMCLVLTFGALVGTLLLTALAPLLIPLLYGEAFVSAVPLLQILAWGMPLLVLRQSRILYGYALGAEQRVNVLMLLGVIGQMIAAFVLIPSYGVMGAAWTFIIGEVWGALVLWFTPFEPSPTTISRH
jgi:O-antigen/teichoic acid export membrane protein